MIRGAMSPPLCERSFIFILRTPLEFIETSPLDYCRLSSYHRVGSPLFIFRFYSLARSLDFSLIIECLFFLYPIVALLNFVVSCLEKVIKGDFLLFLVSFATDRLK